MPPSFADAIPPAASSPAPTRSGSCRKTTARSERSHPPRPEGPGSSFSSTTSTSVKSSELVVVAAVSQHLHRFTSALPRGSATEMLPLRSDDSGEALRYYEPEEQRSGRSPTSSAHRRLETSMRAELDEADEDGVGREGGGGAKERRLGVGGFGAEELGEPLGGDAVVVGEDGQDALGVHVDGEEVGDVGGVGADDLRLINLLD